MPETQQVNYSMVHVGRIHPPQKQVLRDISLGFYYGAKIGVLGLNGAGKSTLLRILDGVDNDYVGETMVSKGYTRGLLEQEPQLDENKTVKQVVEEAVQPLVSRPRDHATLAFEDDGTVSGYEADRRKRLGTAADQSHRASHRKLAG